MAKLHFHYSTMNAGKSTALLQAAHNYGERGMEVVLLTARHDTRAGSGRISSRIGVSRPADTYAPGTDIAGPGDAASRPASSSTRPSS